ncbi:MAG: hypothetical protein LBU15_04180 [Rickettsiales bacterium]|nr:hypothetical protein [Rickettsiales bacterium]
MGKWKSGSYLGVALLLSGLVDLARATPLRSPEYPGGVLGLERGTLDCETGVPLDKLLDSCRGNFTLVPYSANGKNGSKSPGELPGAKLCPGDLLFQVVMESDFDDAVARSALATEAVTHVGIFYPPDTVIEANDFGVVETNVCEFIKKADRNVLARVKDRSIVQSALERAKSFLGRPYSNSFLPNSEGLYCSELVTESFLNADGSRYFELRPMNFEPESYWLEYFEALDLAIPEDVFGSHPQQILDQGGRLTPFGKILYSK